MKMKKKMRALISVHNKQGIVEFAKDLVGLGIEIISSGGTAKILKKAGISVKEVSEVTGFPEMLDGRVKTLHPRIHAGILANRTINEHMETLQRYRIKTIDIVVVNLYPFEKTIEEPKVSIQEVIENIDIGGPTLIRAAAKNYRDVLIVTSPDQYQEITKLLRSEQDIGTEKRENLAIKAFSHTAQYDAIISNYLRQRWTGEDFPKNLTIPLVKIQDLRYGENPHQKAAFYKEVPATKEPCISNAKKLQGKELSGNNILDANSAIECVGDFTEPTCVIVKHNTPCGIASADNLLKAWKNAFATDTESPYGGIVAFNRRVEKDVAEEVKNRKSDCWN
jgi:phosphoribosylaminoimidazolecarboxamide formyltransferase/IMP cyclohydrolase